MSKITKNDWVVSTIAATSFMLGAIGGIIISTWTIGIATHHKDYGMAGIMFVPFALLGIIIGAWGLTYIVLRYIFKFMNLGSSSTTYRIFAGIVILSVIPPMLVGTVTSRAFVTVPVLFFSLMLTYLLARFYVLK